VRVVCPPDVAMLADAARHRLVVTAEDGVRHGGAGSFVLDAMAAQVESTGLVAPTTRVLGIPRQYLAQGKADDILASLGLDGAGIAESVRRALTGVDVAPTAEAEPPH
jgi:1-deoxy-D-xylulose-5-phosphate synthase